MNTIEQLLNQPWAISEDGMRSLLAKVKPGQARAWLFGDPPQPRDRAPRTDVNGVAVISVYGDLVKRPTTAPSGWLESYEAVRRSLDEALDDSSVEAVLLDIDSFGGTVDGVKELADRVRAASDIKPIYALANGAMTSAAFWIGASTGRVYASSPLAMVGSIGVVQLHMDWSKWNEEVGINPTWIHSGKAKAYGNPDEPLGKEELAYFQERLDQSYHVFLQAVGEALDLDTTQVEAWADGQYFQADRGLELGLVHGILPRDELLQRIQEDVMNMTAAELRDKHPGAVQEIVKSVEQAEQAKAETAKAEAVGKGREEERVAMLALAEVALGKEAGEQLAKLAEAGVTKAQLEAIGYQPSAQDKSDGKGEAKQQGANAQILEQLQKHDPSGVQSGGAVQPQTDEQKCQAAIDRMAKVEV